MAQFKIYLLNPISKDNLTYYDNVLIGDYNSLTPQNSFSYTYDEKIEFKENAQKTFTFSMNRKSFMHDNWQENPFVSRIKNGSLIMLNDKYDKVYFFIVNKIQYSFKEHNIIYNYSCTDAFSYQNTRQNSGYTLENDATSDDYIGPHTLDWWAIKKIIPECRIYYKYIPIGVGLYKNTNQTTNLVNFIRYNSVDELTNNIETTQTRQILKEPFHSYLNNEDEYQQTFDFSCDNSTADAALIALGENLDMMIETYEDFIDNKLIQFFWFTPVKNQKISGLSYSPTKDVKTFSLTQASDSLTTVLNVNSTTVGDELVTLFPNTPGVFTSLFGDDSVWNKEKVYYPGMFTNVIEGLKVSYNQNGYFIDTTNKLIVFPLTQNFQMKSQYDFFRSYWDAEHQTNIQIQYPNVESVTTINHRNTKLKLILSENIIDTDHTDYIIIPEDSSLSDYANGKQYNIALACSYIEEDQPQSISATFYLNFYHLFSEDEQEFAKIAEACPWLENKLIDFSYFLKEGYITSQEYNTLMSRLQNDLRVVNGKIFYYTDAYYRALQQKVRILSEIQANLDSLGAQFEALIVTPLKNGESINQDSWNTFKAAYDSVFKQTNTNLTNNSILDYETLIRNYFTKYMDAEQRFLKNIYNFKKYFNEKFSNTQNITCQISDIAAEVKKDNNHFIALKTPTFNDITDFTTAYNIFKLENNHYIKAYIPTTTNIVSTPFYYPKVTAGSIKLINDTEEHAADWYDYNSQYKYYLTETDYYAKFQNNARTTPIIITDNNEKYVQLTSREIQRLFYTVEATQKAYFQKNTSTYIPFDRVRCSCNEIADYFAWFQLPHITDYWDTDDLNKTIYSLTSWPTQDCLKETLWEYYKALLPVDTIYWKGPIYKVSTSVNETKTKTVYKIDRVNSAGETEATLKSAIEEEAYQPIPLAANGQMISRWFHLSEAGENFKSSLTSQWTYYSGCYSPNLAGWITLGSGLLYNPVNILFGATILAFHPWNLSFENKKDADVTIEAFDDDHNPISTSGLMSINDDIKSNYYACDSYYGNYLKTAESYNNFTEATSIVNRFYNWTDWKGPDFWNASLDLVLEVKGCDYSTIKSWKQYFNYYNYIVATYSFHMNPEDDKDKVYLKNPSYYQFITPSHIINPTDKYLRLTIYSGTGYLNGDNIILNPVDDEGIVLEQKCVQYILDPTIFEDKLISAIKWYPLSNISETVSFKTLITDTTQHYTLKDLITKNLTEDNIKIQWDGSALIVLNTDTSFAIKYLFYKEEKYKKVYFTTVATEESLDTDDVLIFNPLTTEYFSAINYDKKTEEQVSLLEVTGILKNIDGLYCSPNENTDFASFTEEDQVDFENTLFYYKTKEGKYKRTYSITQLQAALNDTSGKGTDYCSLTEAKKFKSLMQSTQEDYYFDPTKTQFDITLYLCDLTADTNGYYSINSRLYKTQSYEFEYEDNIATSKPIAVKIIDNGNTYITNLTQTITYIDDLSNMTNGTLWYKYHDKINYAALFNAALTIETQLETYWTAAYTASKYCKYFLPQSWQPGVGENKNAFYKEIVLVQYDDNGAFNKVILSEDLLPNVSIYIDEANESQLSMFSNQHYLPKYTWYWKNSAYNDTNLSIETADKITSTEENEQYLNDLNNDIQLASDVEILTNNPGIRSILQYLNTDISEWMVIKNGYTVYYYSTGNGLLWQDVINHYDNHPVLEHFGGLYDMEYYLIKNTYSRDTSIRETYNDLITQRNAIWQDLLSNYPFLFLEDNYTYDLATDSQTLLQKAQFVFKQKSQPENSYNISLIDINSLKGYHGQELKPGQGILLDVREYYDELDSIWNAINQYLFISSISYTLRSDADISVSVNQIKYEEKLLQSLVKLIR